MAPGNSFISIPDFLLEIVFSYIDTSSDRSSISLVCKQWYNIDRRTRKDITVANCYSVLPSSLTRRFTSLETVKIKGKPRCSMFKLIPDDWGGYAKPWISEFVLHCKYLKSVHLRRMIVSDEDLFALAGGRSYTLQVLKLDKCSGFSTIGLEAITASCRSLRVLFLDESTIEDKGGNWLHQLALYNTCLEVLNFYGTDLVNTCMEDLLAIADNCRSLNSIKLNEYKLESVGELLSKKPSLCELGGLVIGSNDESAINAVINLPTGLTSLVGLYYAGGDEGDDMVNRLVKPVAPGLKKIDLQFAFLSVQGHCQLLRQCSNLEALEVFNAIGDDGLEVIANNCKNLRRLRVERGDREVQQGFVTHKGIIPVALNCHHLEYIAAYVSDINNSALSTIASNCPKLKDFRLVLLDEDNEVSDFPLDEGVITIIQKCQCLERFALYLRPGFLTDKGMQEIGIYGKKLRWALFGLVGESDMGLSLFADGCQNLEKLEMRDCSFTESAITAAILKMQSLKHVWVQGYKSTSTGHDLLPMNTGDWRVEFMPSSGIEGMDQPTQFVAYRSLAPRRNDNPETVICFGSNDAPQCY